MRRAGRWRRGRSQRLRSQLARQAEGVRRGGEGRRLHQARPRLPDGRRDGRRREPHRAHIGELRQGEGLPHLQGVPGLDRGDPADPAIHGAQPPSAPLQEVAETQSRLPPQARPDVRQHGDALLRGPGRLPLPVPDGQTGPEPDADQRDLPPRPADHRAVRQGGVDEPRDPVRVGRGEPDLVRADREGEEGVGPVAQDRDEGREARGRVRDQGERWKGPLRGGVPVHSQENQAGLCREGDRQDANRRRRQGGPPGRDRDPEAQLAPVHRVDEEGLRDEEEHLHHHGMAQARGPLQGHRQGAEVLRRRRAARHPAAVLCDSLLPPPRDRAQGH
mmetsp:Transcript_9114/g.22362  ORF Transcript_9114/g.22362 Transcript_9114/m.22362 type:complete len:332 (-) Transcript_9114:504-1499(-)